MICEINKKMSDAWMYDGWLYEITTMQISSDEWDIHCTNNTTRTYTFHTNIAISIPGR